MNPMTKTVLNYFSIGIQRNYYHYIFCLVIAFFCNSYVHAQNSILHGTVVGAEGEPLAGASILDIEFGRNAITDRRGDFYIAVDSLSELEIRYVGYTSASIAQFRRADTLRRFIQLDPQIENLREFEVRSAVFQAIAEEKAVNVLDFVPYQDFVLTLETRGRQRYLAFYQEPDSVQRFPLKRINGRSLFEDCFGNVHVLADDSAYQVYISDQVHVIAAISTEQFEENIEPCVADFEENTFFEGYARSNKMYSLLGYAPESEKPECYLKVWDKTGEAMAREEYDSIVNLYYAMTIPVQNIILNKSWDGDIVALSNTPALTKLIGWYTKISLRNIEVKTFSTDSHLVAFNCFNDSITVMDTSGKIIRQLPFGDGNERVKSILYDKFDDTFYAFNLDGSNKGIYSIDPSSGKKEFIGSHKGLGRAEHLAVCDGNLYFIVKGDGLGKVYRAALTDLN